MLDWLKEMRKRTLALVRARKGIGNTGDMSEHQLTREEYFLSDAEFADLYRTLRECAHPVQTGLMLLGQLPPWNRDEAPYLRRISKALYGMPRFVEKAFVAYYGLTGDERRRLEISTTHCFRGAVILSHPDAIAHLKSMRRHDVYPSFWNILLIETLRLVLLGGCGLHLKLIGGYGQLDSLDDREFSARFESSWREVMKYRDAYYGFLVQPKVGLTNIVRYLKMMEGNRRIRFMASDYLLHQCQERPFLLEAISPLFKERAFRDRVKAAYHPLVEHSVRDILRMTEASLQEIHGDYGQHWRRMVGQAFDEFLRDFDYYFKTRPKELQIPRHAGMVGGIPEDIKHRMEEHLDVFLPPDWDREISFTYYIREKLAYLAQRIAKEHRGRADGSATITTILDSDRNEAETSEDELYSAQDWGSTAREQKRLLREKKQRWFASSPDKEIQGPDGRTYLRIHQMAETVSLHTGFSITARQIRNWIKSGAIPATQINTLFGTHVTIRQNHWLFEKSEEVVGLIVETAQASLGEIPNTVSRAGLSGVLRSMGKPCGRSTIIRYEKAGRLTPISSGAAIYYSYDDVKRLTKELIPKRGRPSKNSSQE